MAAPMWSRTATWTAVDPLEGADVGDLLGADLDRWRLLAVRAPERARRFLAGRRMVRELVEEFGLFIWRGFAASVPGRKPAFARPLGDFSVSYSGDTVLVVVVVDGRVGADVETDPTPFRSPALLRRICTPRESALIRSRPVDERPAWLARVWTAKEALLKLDGRGLREDPRTLDVADHVTSAPVAGPPHAAIAVDGAGSGVVLRFPDIGAREEPAA